MFKILLKRKKNQEHFVPLFDTVENIYLPSIHRYEFLSREDIRHSFSFLKAYSGSAATFNTYRRDLERLLQWSEKVCNKSLKEIKRDDIEEFVYFCQKPPKTWIGLQKTTRFITQEGSLCRGNNTKVT